MERRRLAAGPLVWRGLGLTQHIVAAPQPGARSLRAPGCGAATTSILGDDDDMTHHALALGVGVSLLALGAPRGAHL